MEEPFNDVIEYTEVGHNDRKLLNRSQYQLLKIREDLAASIFSKDVEKQPTIEEMIEFSTEKSRLAVIMQDLIIVKSRNKFPVVDFVFSDSVRLGVFQLFPLDVEDFPFPVDRDDVEMKKLLRMYHFQFVSTDNENASLKDDEIVIDLLTWYDILAYRNDDLKEAVGSEIFYRESWKTLLNSVWNESNITIKFAILQATNIRLFGGTNQSEYKETDLTILYNNIVRHVRR